MNALDPTILISILTENILKYLNVAKYEETMNDEENEKKRLADIAGRLESEDAEKKRLDDESTDEKIVLESENVS